jgi:hypothetical protein
MKKTTLCLMTLGLSLTIQTSQLSASVNDESLVVTTAKPTESETAETLLTRLNRINETDKSHLTLSEKKDLRIEVRSIKKQLTGLGGGLYISGGAVILIVILLIILL